MIYFSRGTVGHLHEFDSLDKALLQLYFQQSAARIALDLTFIVTIGFIEADGVPAGYAVDLHSIFPFPISE
jgi:hypothetical protein